MTQKKVQRKKKKINPYAVIRRLIFPVCTVIAILILNAVFRTGVTKFEVREYTDTSASLFWTDSGKSERFILYFRENAADPFTQLDTLENTDRQKEMTYTASALSSACTYEFALDALGKGEIASADPAALPRCSVRTMPAAPQVSVSSEKIGTMQIKWSDTQQVDGYELQYDETDSFGRSKCISCDAEDSAFLAEALNSTQTYYAHVRSYTVENSKKTYSAWSDTVSVVITDVDKPRVDPKKPMLALTFDDGPGFNGASEDILDTLEKYDARATFFMVGNNVREKPENVRRKAELGCELGNHTNTHKSYGANVTAENIRKCSDAIYEACGQRPTAFRSPGGKTNDALRGACEAQGLPLYYWSIDTKDWSSKNADKIYNHVMNNAKDGDIILMHEIYTPTADAIRRMVPDLIDKGFQLVTVSELVEAKSGKPPVPGQQYVTGVKIRNATE